MRYFEQERRWSCSCSTPAATLAQHARSALLPTLTTWTPPQQATQQAHMHMCNERPHTTKT